MEEELEQSIDIKGAVGVILGSLLSFVLMIYIHVKTASERRLRKESDSGISSKLSSNSNDLELTEKRSRVGSLDNGFSRDSEIVSMRASVRYPFIDVARGMAIWFVVYFHYIWNLRHNGILPEVFKPERDELFREIIEFWIFYGICFLIMPEVYYRSVYLFYFAMVLVTTVCIMWHYWASQASGVGMIMFCIGLSSYVQNREVIQWSKIRRRVYNLVLVAGSITAVTYLFLPDEFIYFGAIHCIALVSILHLPLLMFPRYSLLGTIFVFGYRGLIGDFPLEVPVFRNTVDHMPWFENLGYLFFGIYWGYLGMHTSPYWIRFLPYQFKEKHLEESIFPYLGRHSLFIFIAHQVVLFPIVKLCTGHSLFE